MQLHQPLRQGETQARTLVAAAYCTFPLLKGSKYPLQIFTRYSYSRVLNGNSHPLLALQ